MVSQTDYCSQVFGVLGPRLPGAPFEAARAAARRHFPAAGAGRLREWDFDNGFVACFRTPAAAGATDREPPAGDRLLFLLQGPALPGLPGIPDAALIGSCLAQGSSAVLLDHERSTLTLGRDAAGVQALYYAVLGAYCYFSSSLACFRHLELAIDPAAVQSFLHFLYVPAPRTIYLQAQAVLPGEVVSWGGGRLERHLPPAEPPDPAAPWRGPEDLRGFLDAYAQKLQESLSRRALWPGKSALLLSGGKDSSALAIASRQAGVQLDAVTLGFAGDQDEGDDARLVAHHLGLPFRLLAFSAEQYRAAWPDFIRSLGQPMGDPASLPVFLAMRELGDRYQAYVDGTGNDGYFGIPSTRQEDLAWRLYRRFPFLRGLSLLNGRLAPHCYTLSVLEHALAGNREEQFVSWKGWTAPELGRLTGFIPDWSGTELYRIYREVSGPMAHKTRTLCEIWEPEAAYRKTAQSAATHGKAVLYPFLDRDLVRFSASLPAGLKCRGTTNKVLLRSFLADHLPPRALQKPKGAFNFPKSHILTGAGHRYLEQYLSRERLAAGGLVDPDLATRTVAAYRQGDRGLEDRVWGLLVLHSWFEEQRTP